MTINALINFGVLPRMPEKDENPEPVNFMFGNFRHALDKAKEIKPKEVDDAQPSRTTFDVKFSGFGDDSYDIGEFVIRTALPSAAFDSRWLSDKDENSVYTATNCRWNPLIMTFRDSENNILMRQTELQMQRQRSSPKDAHFDAQIKLNDQNGKWYRAYTLRSCTITNTVPDSDVAIDKPINPKFYMTLQFYNAECWFRN